MKVCRPCVHYVRLPIVTQSRKVKKALIIGKINEAMKEQLMTRAELAARMGVTGSQITKQLSMAGNPTLNSLFTFEEIIGVTIIDLRP